MMNLTEKSIIKKKSVKPVANNIKEHYQVLFSNCQNAANIIHINI